MHGMHQEESPDFNALLVLKQSSAFIILHLLQTFIKIKNHQRVQECGLSPINGLKYFDNTTRTSIDYTNIRKLFIFIA